MAAKTIACSVGVRNVISSAAGPCENGSLVQVLALRRQHVGRVQRFLAAFLHLGMQEVGQNRQNWHPNDAGASWTE
jgi:hypothetical protein